MLSELNYRGSVSAFFEEDMLVSYTESCETCVRHSFLDYMRSIILAGKFCHFVFSHWFIFLYLGGGPPSIPITTSELAMSDSSNVPTKSTVLINP